MTYLETLIHLIFNLIYDMIALVHHIAIPGLIIAVPCLVVYYIRLERERKKNAEFDKIHNIN